jgi:hypothetical protein
VADFQLRRARRFLREEEFTLRRSFSSSGANEAVSAFWQRREATFCGFIATQSVKGCRSRVEFAVFYQQNSCASALCRSSKSIRTKERKGTGHGQSSHENEDCSEEEDGGEEARRQEARRQARLIWARLI